MTKTDAYFCGKRIFWTDAYSVVVDTVLIWWGIMHPPAGEATLLQLFTCSRIPMQRGGLRHPTIPILLAMCLETSLTKKQKKTNAGMKIRCKNSFITMIDQKYHTCFRACCLSSQVKTPKRGICSPRVRQLEHFPAQKEICSFSTILPFYFPIDSDRRVAKTFDNVVNHTSRLFQFSLSRINLLLNFGTASLLCMELFLQMVPFFLCNGWRVLGSISMSYSIVEPFQVETIIQEK